MKFNKLIAAGTILAVNLVNLPHAFAANTITFNGNITDATCDVSLEYKGAAVGTAGTGTIAPDEVSKQRWLVQTPLQARYRSLLWLKTAPQVRLQKPKWRPTLKVLTVTTRAI